MSQDTNGNYRRTGLATASRDVVCEATSSAYISTQPSEAKTVQETRARQQTSRTGTSPKLKSNSKRHDGMPALVPIDGAVRSSNTTDDIQRVDSIDTPSGPRANSKSYKGMPGLIPIDGAVRSSDTTHDIQRGDRTDTPSGPRANSKSYKGMPGLVPIDTEAQSNGHTIGETNSNPKGSPAVQKAAPKVAAKPTGVQTDAFERNYNIQVADSGRYEDHFLQITYTNSPSAAEAFVRAHFGGCTEVGFDLEHKPTYRPGQKPNVSLLQFAPVLPEHVRADNAHIPVLVYSIYHDSGKIPQCLCDIMASSRIAKYGVGIKGDLRLLSFLNLSQPAREAYKELGPLAHKVGLTDKPGIGLKALVERCLGIECTTYKTKRLTMTNWETNSFREAEIKYAAMDAWTAIECLSFIKYVDGTDPDGRSLL